MIYSILLIATYTKLGEDRKAFNYYKQAHEMIRNLYNDSDDINVAQSLSNLGVAYELIFEEKKAIDYKLQGLEMKKRLLLPDQYSQDIIDSLNSICLTFIRLGEYKKALEYKLQALEANKKILKNDTNVLSDCLTDIANLYERMGDEKKASEFNKEAIKLNYSLDKI